ncbi:hypothetical protein McanMca71_005495 [Microsporum canis]|uniref:Acetyltransferase n=1 Tax=Arthroderma otae (strain ATCC MYA-4605 / CBS 113480) TaxID=554155 RepID=C5FQG2_ARTOC|nr:acetyltransferase [Microsporum canis CBS 113480]EEQ32115.1 acetyltransferase [Microsporum canis CBS 113480]
MAKIYVHPDPSRRLVALLQRHLPHSGPVLRVIQSFGILPRSAEACVLATLPPDAESDTEAENGGRGASSVPEDPWMVAYVDVFRYPETQIWIYSSLEADGMNETVGDVIKTTLTADEETQRQACEQLRSLLAYVRTKLVPSLLSTPGATEKNIVRSQTNGIKKVPVVPPTGLLMGTVNDGLSVLFNQLGYRDEHDPFSSGHKKPFFHVNRVDLCVKFMFDRSHYDSGDNKPTPGYRFHDRKGRHGIQDHQFSLVLSRTHIQRTRASFPASVALYCSTAEDAAAKPPGETSSGDKEGANSEEMPVGWAFFTYDGSMIVLHVEPEYRGRGLASLLSREIMRRGMGHDAIHALQLEGDVEGRERGWVFADVSIDNTASQRVMQKLGGRPGWAMRWIGGEFTGVSPVIDGT